MSVTEITSKQSRPVMLSVRIPKQLDNQIKDVQALAEKYGLNWSESDIKRAALDRGTRELRGKLLQTKAADY